MDMTEQVIGALDVSCGARDECHFKGLIGIAHFLHALTCEGQSCCREETPTTHEFVQVIRPSCQQAGHECKA